MQLSLDKAKDALSRAGESLGLNIEQTAWGIHDIVNENMASAARTHIAEKGFDARDFAMVATGGAGPVHAVDVARRLRIRKVLCPIASGVGSCLGFLAAPARADRTWSKVELLESFDEKDLEERLAAASAAIESDLADCGLVPEDIVWRLTVDVRYAGQGNAVEVIISEPDLTMLSRDEINRRFDEEYVRLYRKTVPGGEPELVTWRVNGSSPGQVKHFRLAQTGETEPAGERRIFLADERRYESVPVYQRYSLPVGSILKAPLILSEPESTLVVAYPGTVSVLESGTVQVELEEGE